jgi:hypothetical protein
MTFATEQGTVPVAAEKTHGKHHAEIVVFTRDAEGPGATGEVYNTLGLTDEFSDEQFDALFRALNPEALKATFGGDVVWKNGPRRAQMDSLTATALNEGRTSPVGDIPMQTVATMHIPDLDVFVGSTRPYTEMTVGRTTKWVFDRGREVYELLAPNGSVYVMQSASQAIDPDLTAERLPSLGQRQQRPDGWQYRVRTLDDELVVLAQRGDVEAHIVLDEFENNYQRVDN